MSYTATTLRENKPRSGIALGGIGSGWFEIRQDGRFYNWNIFNNRPVARGKHFDDDQMSVLFFLVRYEVEGEEPRIRLLEIENSHGAGGMRNHEYHYIFPWLDGVDRIQYDATVPFAKLTFEEASMPLEVELSAWSPFIPHDAKHSSLPVAYFDFKVRSTSNRPVRVSLLATVRNRVGYDLPDRLWESEVIREANWNGFNLSANNIDPKHPTYGTMGMASIAKDSRVCASWGHLHPFYEDFLRQPEIPEAFENSEHLNYVNRKSGSDKITAAQDCFGSAGASKDLNPGDCFEHSFCFYWDFPNRYARQLNDRDGSAGYLEESAQTIGEIPDTAAHIEGHNYSNYFASPTEIAHYAVEHIDYLREQTRAFHDAFYDSSLPEDVLDQVNSHFNTFRTSAWYTQKGNFGILEGLSQQRSFAGLMTIDVAMYGAVSTAALFPELDRSSLRAHEYYQGDNGSISHSIIQNFIDNDPREASGKRVDMPGQYVFQVLKSGLMNRDLPFLESIWPSAKRALEYILRERDPNQDSLPDMEGIMCSYDNFPMYGVAPYVATQWLAAITAAIETAKLLNDTEAEQRYQEVLAIGSKTIESKTWNGEYYGLYANEDGLDNGCLSDQILGIWACHVAGLPTFLDSDRISKALDSIIRMNYRADQGLRNCQWPEDTFLHPVSEDCWVDQANTCWTGVELAFASLLIYENKFDDALMIIRNVDQRYRRWGMYWDHQEFGGHYFRPMSAWTIVPASLGHSICNGIATFDPKVERNACRLFFMTANGYGHYTETEDTIRIELNQGTLEVSTLRIRTGAHWTLAEGSPAENDFTVIDVSEAEPISASNPLILTKIKPLDDTACREYSVQTVS